jgi:hypothetical protein
MQGTTVDLSMDFDEIHEQAKDLKHGKDLGNGWGSGIPSRSSQLSKVCLEKKKSRKGR